MLAAPFLASSSLLLAGAAAACAPVRASQASSAVENGDASARGDRRPGFGFRGLEIYKVGEGTSGLVSGDFDGDGLGDLACIDNRRSRVQVLRRLPPGAPDAPDPDAKPGPNALRFDGRFERRRYPVEKRVLALEAGDWNGDKKSDLAWVAEGGELTVLWSDAKGGAPREEKRTVDGLRSGCTGLLAADFDRDGQVDLIAIAPNELLGFPSVPAAAGGRGLGDPVVLDTFEAAPTRAFLADLDGAEGSDLLYAYVGSDAPLRYRLSIGARPSGEGARFGPRIDVELPAIRSVGTIPASKPSGPKPSGTDVLAIFKLSGRLSELAFAPLESGRRALLRHALKKDGERGDVKRTFACGDLDGDGAADVLVAEPGTASIAIGWGTRERRGLDFRSYPSLTGMAWPKIADVDGDGKKEVLCISSSERMLGVARVAGTGATRSLAFPETRPIDGEPVALDAADLDGDGRADAVVLVTQGEGRARKHRLEVRSGTADGHLSEPKTYPLEGLKKTPYALRMIDLDRDGQLDAIAFEPGEKAIPTLILQTGGAFVADDRGEDAPGLGILAGAGPDSVFVADVDGDGKPELLVAQANFVRALAFDRDAAGRAVPRVVAQLNAPAPDAKLSAVAFADWDGDGRPELLVRDETTRDLLALARGEKGSEGGLRLLESAAYARLEFVGMTTADLDGDGRADLVAFGRNEIGVLYGGAKESGFEETASYEPHEERVILDQITSGDLGGDGKKEVVATELTRHAIDVLERDGTSLAHVIGFEVFEKKAFEDQNPEREPREMRCTDVDGDGRTDLVLLVHDKLIVYFQE